jgi:hypothetical protein
MFRYEIKIIFNDGRPEKTYTVAAEDAGHAVTGLLRYVDARNVTTYEHLNTNPDEPGQRP